MCLLLSLTWALLRRCYQQEGLIATGRRRTDLLALELLGQALHLAQLRCQVVPLRQQTVQLPAEVADVGLKKGLDVVPDHFVPLFLQKGPLGLQDLVLLLEESDLDREGWFRNRDFRMVFLRAAKYNPARILYTAVAHLVFTFLLSLQTLLPLILWHHLPRWLVSSQHQREG